MACRSTADERLHGFSNIPSQWRKPDWTYRVWDATCAMRFHLKSSETHSRLLVYMWTFPHFGHKLKQGAQVSTAQSPFSWA